MEEWYKLLSPELLSIAYKAGNELAWPKIQALQIVDFLPVKGFTVTGVEIWIPTNPGPTIPVPFVYDWRLKKLPRQGLHPDTAHEFIATFEWDPADRSHGNFDPVFNISAVPNQS